MQLFLYLLFFDFMKFISLFGFLFLALFACQPKQKSNVDIEAEFYKNNKNFTLDKKIEYKGISFTIPSFFENASYADIVVSNQALKRNTYLFNIHFTVEVFENTDQVFRYFPELEVNKDVQNALQDAYVRRRASVSEDYYISIKKKLPERILKHALIQVVGRQNFESNELFYVVSTAKLNEKYYVIQWIAPKQVLSYTYDDFERILSSVSVVK